MIFNPLTCRGFGFPEDPPTAGARTVSKRESKTVLCLEILYPPPRKGSYLYRERSIVFSHGQLDEGADCGGILPMSRHMHRRCGYARSNRKRLPTVKTTPSLHVVPRRSCYVCSATSLSEVSTEEKMG